MLLNQTSPSGPALVWAFDLNASQVIAWQGSSGNNEINVMFTDGALTATGSIFSVTGETTDDTPSLCYGPGQRLFFGMERLRQSKYNGGRTYDWACYWRKQLAIN
jgi:hypothetical protein